MKYFLLPLLVLSCSIAFAQQDTLGFTNKAEAKNLMVNGKKEGKWCEYSEKVWVGTGEGRHIEEKPTTDSSKANEYSLTVYKNGESEGTLRIYYMTGVLKDVVPYSHSKIDGTERRYYADSKLERIIIWKNNDAIKIINYDTNGNEIKK